MAHIATALRDPLVTLSIEIPWTGNLPTVIVGIVNEHYLDDEWERHKQRMMALFKATDPSFILEIKSKSTGFGSNVLDGPKLGEDTATAIQIINCLETNHLRIISLGPGGSHGLFDSIESVIRGWEKPVNEKHIQFIAFGESSNYDQLNFCKGVCLKQFCGNLQFYSTMDFTSYGYFDISKSDQIRQREASVFD